MVQFIEAETGEDPFERLAVVEDDVRFVARVAPGAERFQIRPRRGHDGQDTAGLEQREHARPFRCGMVEMLDDLGGEQEIERPGRPFGKEKGIIVLAAQPRLRQQEMQDRRMPAAVIEAAHLRLQERQGRYKRLFHERDVARVVQPVPMLGVALLFGFRRRQEGGFREYQPAPSANAVPALADIDDGLERPRRAAQGTEVVARWSRVGAPAYRVDRL